MSQEYLHQDIDDFLGAWGSGYARQTGALVGIGAGATTPRKYSSTTFDVEDEFVDWSSSSGEADASYGYASTSADSASVYSASTVSSYAPTVFSRRSIGTSAGHSSRPAQVPAFYRTFQQTMEESDLALDNAAVQNNAGPAAATTTDSHPLWCEFRFVADCSAVFRIDHENEWLMHHEQHLHNQYPRELACWFCNHPFKTSRSNERYSNFTDRMEHIRGHVRDEYQTPDMMRLDFFMIKHMRSQGLISEAKYHAALGHNELPPALRLPDGVGSSSSPEQPQTQWNVSGSSVAHDLARERRQQRPRGGGHRTHGSSRHH